MSGSSTTRSCVVYRRPQRETLAPAANRAAVVGRARVDDLVVVGLAVGAAHASTVPPSTVSARPRRCGSRRDSGSGSGRPARGRVAVARRRARRPAGAGSPSGSSRVGDRPQRVAGADHDGLAGDEGGRTGGARGKRGVSPRAPRPPPPSRPRTPSDQRRRPEAAPPVRGGETRATARGGGARDGGACVAGTGAHLPGTIVMAVMSWACSCSIRVGRAARGLRCRRPQGCDSRRSLAVGRVSG